jgi:hypothetical protein
MLDRVIFLDKSRLSHAPHPGLIIPGVLRHSVKLCGLDPRIHHWKSVSSIQTYTDGVLHGLYPRIHCPRERVEHPGLPGLRHSVKLRSLPQDTSLRERVEHPGLPGVLCYSVNLRTSTPGYIAERACRASRPTWGIASLRQTTDMRGVVYGFTWCQWCQNDDIDDYDSDFTVLECGSFPLYSLELNNHLKHLLFKDINFQFSIENKTDAWKCHMMAIWPIKRLGFCLGLYMFTNFTFYSLQKLVVDSCESILKLKSES